MAIRYVTGLGDRPTNSGIMVIGPGAPATLPPGPLGIPPALAVVADAPASTSVVEVPAGLPLPGELPPVLARPDLALPDVLEFTLPNGLEVRIVKGKILEPDAGPPTPFALCGLSLYALPDDGYGGTLIKGTERWGISVREPRAPVAQVTAPAPELEAAAPAAAAQPAEQLATAEMLPAPPSAARAAARAAKRAQKEK